jgi:hypothetical protein
MKDCVIIESYLDVAGRLRGAGHPGRLVFCTTNTSDYTASSRRRLHADLVADFDRVGLAAAFDLLAARYAIRS